MFIPGFVWHQSTMRSTPCLTVTRLRAPKWTSRDLGGFVPPKKEWSWPRRSIVSEKRSSRGVRFSVAQCQLCQLRPNNEPFVENDQKQLIVVHVSSSWWLSALVVLFSDRFFTFSTAGGYLPPEEIKERFDSNCITPVSFTCATLRFLMCVSVNWKFFSRPWF